MNLLQSLVLGLIQGVTEFLPISSSGHLVLFGKIFGLTNVSVFFASMLHLGTLGAVLVVMRREIVEILKDLFGRLTWLILLATIPAIAFALLLGGLVDRLFSSGESLGYEFLFTGVVLIVAVFVKKGERPLAKLRVVDALASGVGQAVAILPAVSRSACSLVPMLFLGVERKAAIRFTFLLSIPAILGSLVLDLKDVLTGDTAALLDAGVPNIAMGVVAAALAGFVTMRLMLNLLTRRGFLWFGLYVVALGIFVLLDQNVLHLLPWGV